ncbi:hypothetical protein QTV44_002468 [Vibrio vulnificus]|nr:hypothetical protein [Vibrio vulnificus]
MIDIKNIADECCRFLTSVTSVYGSVVTSDDEYRRLRFDVYTSLLNMGFVIDEVVAFPSVLSRTPEEYYYCDPSLVDTFHVSPQTLRNSHKVLSPKLLGIIRDEMLSDNDRHVLRRLLPNLPLTPNQINTTLMNEGVITSPISHVAMMYLFEMVGDTVDAWLAPKYAPRDKSSKRAARFSRPTVPVLFNDTVAKNQLVSYINKLVRAAEKISSVIGFVDLDLLVKISPLDKFKAKKSVLKEFLRSFFSYREEYCDNGSYIIISKVDDSDFVRRLGVFIQSVGAVSPSIASPFMLRCINYKCYLSQQGLDEHNEQLAKDSFSTKFRTSDYELDYVPSDVALWVLSHSELLHVSESSIGLSSLAFNRVNEMFWVDYFLQYRSSQSYRQYDNISEAIDAFCDYIIGIFQSEFRYCLVEPKGFFGVTSDKVYVESVHSNHSANHRGDYIQPNATLLDEEFHSVFLEFKEFQDLLESNYEVYSRAFYNKYADKTASQVNNFFKDDFIEDLYEWLSRSPIDTATGFIERNISKFEGMIANIDARRNNNYQLAELLNVRNDQSIESLNTRRTQVEFCLDESRAILERLKTSEVASETLRYQSELERLTSAKKALKIRTVDFKYYLLIHDLIVGNGGEVSREDFDLILQDYLDSLCVNVDGKLSLIRVVAHRILSQHPFAI